MSRLTLKVVRAVKRCTGSEDELIAHIQSFDKHPEPIAALTTAVLSAVIPCNKPKRKYQRRDMRAGA